MFSPTDSEAPWLHDLTIGEVLHEIVGQFGDREAVVFPQLGRRTTYRELQRQVDATARGLLALGIGKGDKVAVWATNVPEWPILQLATAKIGAVLVTVNPAYLASELEYVLEQSQAKALFLVDEFKSSRYFDLVAEVCPDLQHAREGAVRSTRYPELRWIVALKGQHPAGMLSWARMLELGGRVDPERLVQAGRELDPSDPINLQYTSGTTGFPKAAMLAHRNLLLNAHYVSACQRLTETDRVCVPVPFYHCFGCVVGTLGTLVRGATMVVPAEHFDPVATLDAIERERATIIYGVPTMFIAMLDHPSFEGRNLGSLRSGIMAGSPCPIKTMHQVVDRMGVAEITIAYGQTETSPVITQTQVEDPIEVRVQTVGKPLPGVEVKIVDPATGDEIGANRQGELCARGHNIMLGYYRNPEATSKAIDADGWIHTGDLALRRDDGFYKITGRITDMVIRGGENIYPREIEEQLFKHPAVENVSVVGVPDEKFGEELCAWIVPKARASLTPEEVREYCRGHLAHYKAPRYVKLVSGFPMTVSGKIQKFKIREQMVHELGLREQETA